MGKFAKRVCNICKNVDFSERILVTQLVNLLNRTRFVLIS